jgi:1-acyl-sn-glycerol-3-phosphate acyltransferase
LSRLHKPKAGFWIRFAVVVLYPVDTILFKIRWRRLDRIPARGGVILVVNHLSYIDTILMARLVWASGRIPRFMIKSAVFAKPFLGRVMRGAGQIPVHRGTIDAQQSLRYAKKALDEGQCVVIYAEGTITRDPEWWPMQARTGVARLAMMAPDVPVVPVGQWGPQFTFDARAHTFRPFPRKMSLAAVGDPVDLNCFRGREPDAAVLRRMTDQIMGAVRDLVAELRQQPAPREFFVPPARIAAKGEDPGTRAAS